VNGCWLRAAGAWGQCAPAALILRGRADPQLHRYAPIVVLCEPRFHLAIQGCNSNVYTDSYLIRSCARMLRA